MKKLTCFLTALLCLSLAACGGEPAGTWTPVEDSPFSLEAAAGVDTDAQPVGPADFDPAVINDPAHDYNPKGWLDEDTVLCTRSNAGSFSCYEMVAVTLDGQVTVLDADIHPSTMITAQDGIVIMGSYYETILDDGIIFARWDGSETLTPIHEFDEGTALSFQQFFSPDGSKAVLSWIPEVPGTDWQVRILDLDTGDYQDIIPPEITSEEPVLLLSRWLDDATLLITATDLMPEGYTAAWEYAVP